MFSEDGYQALTSGAGVVRRHDRAVLRVTGPDRLIWLQGLLTNDVVSLPVGGVCDAAYLTPQGRMITEMRVFNLAERTLLDVPASLSASLQSRLESLLFSEDAQISDVSNGMAIVDLHGPEAPRMTKHPDLIRDDAFGVPGYSALVPKDGVEPAVAGLVAQGAIETDLDSLEVVRIEAGRPRFLVDMDEHTIPLEAGLERTAISFSKGCYVGQEVIVRVTHRGGGRVAKKLVGFRLEGGDVPQHGDLVSASDRQIGRITSATWSPALSSAIALGYVHRDFIDPGTSVVIGGKEKSWPATVAALPFISRLAVSGR
jgi:folate-binding protein YgfZ